MSKYALVGLSETLRRELEPLGVGVSVLSPGPVATSIIENTSAARPAAAPRPSTRSGHILAGAHEWLPTEDRSPDDVGVGLSK